MKKLSAILFIFFFIILIFKAQNPLFNKISYENARQLAFSGKEDSALVICDLLLHINQKNSDAICLKARISGWRGQFELSREILKSYPLADSTRYDWFDILSDIEYWEDSYDTALIITDSALAIFPGDSLFSAKKLLLEGLLNPDTLTIRRTDRCMRVQYYFDFFNRMYKRRWHVLSLSSDLNLNSRNILSPKVNLGYLSPVSGSAVSYAFSVESDFYHFSRQNYYLYGNLGFSGSPLFPRIKTGFEYFTPFYFKTEISVGFRYMRWEHNLYYGTMSVSKYYKDYLFIFRPYFPFRNFESSGAYMFSARKYIKDINYVGLSFVIGSAPDQSFDQFLEHGAYHSTKIILSGNKQLKNNHILSLAISYSNEEYSLNLYQNRFDLLLGYNFCF